MRSYTRISSYIVLIVWLMAFTACESSEEISRGFDHEVPSCTGLTLQVNGQSIQVEDANVWKTLWGIVPTVNMQEIVLQTITVPRGTSFDLKVLLTDNVGLKTVELSQPDWLYSKYINFENADGDIPQNPLSYEFTAQVNVPNAAISDVLIETFYFNDGSTIKYLQPYRKLNLNVVDVNMNARVIPVFVKVE